MQNLSEIKKKRIISLIILSHYDLLISRIVSWKFADHYFELNPFVVLLNLAKHTTKKESYSATDSKHSMKFQFFPEPITASPQKDSTWFYFFIRRNKFL